MNAQSALALRCAAVAAAGAVVVATAATPAFAADGDVQVVNTETVQIYTSSTGQVESRRVYEQVALSGNGSVDLKNPISTDGLRNLDGFGGFDVEDGEQITKTTVDGEEKLRSVSDYNGKLPLNVSVAYTLDGKNVKPGDVVGEDGKLEVQFTVENITGTPQEVTFADGKGGMVNKTVDVPIPMVGSLTTVAPPSFTNVKSEQANMAGDGKGGTKMSFTMTLFPPIGSTTAVFGYTADINDGVVPRADITALPVNPLQSPSFKTAGTSYQGGAETGIELTDGATQIDSNLLKLRDGASTLLAGLIKLRDGAGELNSGLAGQAAPGSQKLANGAGDLADGLGQLNSGSLRLADGTGEAFAGSQKLSDGATRLSDGVVQLNDGAGQLDDGATQLAAGQRALAAGLAKLYRGVDALPASVRAKLASDQQYQALLASLQSIADGVGSVDDSPLTPTLLGGINAVEAGMRYPGGFATNDCALALTGGTPTKCGAMDGVEFVAAQLNAGATDLNLLKPVLGILNATSNAGGPCAGYPNYAPPPNPPTNPCQAVATLYYGLFGDTPAPKGAQAKVILAANALTGIQQKVGAQLLADGAGLDRLRAGLSNGNPANCLAAKGTPSPADDCGIKQGALFLKLHGIPMLVDGITESISAELKAGIGRPTAGCDPEATLRCAAAALADGGGRLSAGIDDLIVGVSLLNDGGSQLAAGAGDLSDGLGQIDDGAGQLADGAGRASDGSVLLADGADELADGLKDAANGSGRLADGLETAAGGAPKLVDGAQRLSDEGTKKLIEAGDSTAQNYGELYAVMAAGAERADNEDMAFGAPDDAIGLTAYSYIIQGDDGEGSRNLARGLGGLAILGAGAGVFALRRRLV